MRRYTPLIAAFIFFAMSYLAHGADLTVDLSVIQPDKTSWSRVRVVPYDGSGRAIGSGVQVSVPQGDTSVVVDVTPSSSRPQPGSFYRIWIDGTLVHATFEMPNAPATLSQLFVRSGESPRWLFVGDTPPTSPNVGDAWFDTAGGGTVLKVWYNSVWETVGSGGGNGGGTVRNITFGQLASALQARINALQTESQVEDIVHQEVEDWAEVGDSSTIPAAKLAQGRLTVQDDGTTQGAAQSVHTVNVTGNASATVSGGVATVNVTGGTGGTARSDAQVEELARDAVGAALVTGETGSDINVTTNDAADSIALDINNGAVDFAKLQKDQTTTSHLRDTDAWLIGLQLEELKGGTSGQVLSKGSNDDYDYAWVAQSTGGTGGLNQAQVDARINAAIPANRRVPVYAAGDAGEVLTVQVGGTSLAFAPVESETLEVRTAIPSATGFTVGDIINVDGELYELVASSEARNVITGRNSGAPSGYTGDATFQWGPDPPGNIRLYIPRAWLTSAPSTITIEVDTDTRLHSETVLARAPADDAGNTRWAYHRNPGDAALEPDASIKRYTVHLYSGETERTPLNLTGRTNSHWQSDNRNPGGIAGVSQEAVFDQLRTIVKAGKGTHVTFDDDTNAATISSRIDSGNELPDHPDVGDQFRLLEEDTIQHYLTVPRAAGSQANRIIWTMTGAASPGPYQVYAYGPEFGPNNLAALRDKVFLVVRGGYTVPADLALQFGAEGTTPATYQIANTFEPGFQNWYRVGSLTFAQAAAFQRAQFRFHSTSASYTFPEDTAVDPGDLTYAGAGHGQAGWVPSPGVAAPWATQGQPEPRTLLAVTQLSDGAGTGVSPTNTSNNVEGPLNPFSPAFDLDDDDNQQGIVQVEATLSYVRSSSNTFGFAVPGNHSHRMTGFVFASTLRALANFSATNHATQSVIASVPVVDVSSGATRTLGTLALILAHDSDDELGYFLRYVGSAGSANFEVGVPDLEVVFLHNDGPTERGLTVQEEGTDVGTVSTLNFTGAGATASESNGVATVVIPGGGGGVGSAPTLVQSTAAADVIIDTPAADGWSAWTTIATASATTKAGVVMVIADLDAILTASPAPIQDPPVALAGGGDRIHSAYRLVRNRGGSDTVLAKTIEYGPRNVANAVGVPIYVAATREINSEIQWADNAQSGDVYRVEARHIDQSDTNRRRLTYTAANNKIEVLAW